MATRQADEREHRRGLVLGLTLAEVLLLLLFLLLLAVGAKFREVISAALPPPPPGITLPEGGILGGVSLRYPSLPVFGMSTPTIAFPGIITGSIDPGPFGWPETPSPTSPLESVEAADALEGLSVAAKKINPDDPAAALKRVRQILDGLAAEPGALGKLASILVDTAGQPRSLTVDDLKKAAESLQQLPPEVDLDALIRLYDAQKPSQRTNETGHSWPPIITLTEAEGYFFQSGSAELSSGFHDALNGAVTGRLLEIIKDYPDVNIIEVIGHTDEMPLVLRPSNLDASLLPYLQGQPSNGPLISTDNAGLGLARAAAVAAVLMTDQRLAGLRVLPLSGAQIINVDDRLSTGQGPRDLEKRRRIEIRVRRSEKVLAVQEPAGEPPKPSDKAAVAPVLTDTEAKPELTVQKPVVKQPRADDDAAGWNPFVWSN